MAEASAQDWIMPTGRHAGERITRIRVSYLKWMVNVGHSFADRAEAELKRRGTVTPDLEVSGHAIDRASLLLRKRWHEMRGAEEGLHAWLVRVAGDALREGERHPMEAGRIEYAGMSFRFEMDGRWPVLKTVLPGKSVEPTR